jgi:uncharacterized protein YndB with AHSA1/START domain
MATATPTPGAETFVLTRELDAPRELVFEAFTRLEHLQRWMGPEGTESVGCSLDLRVGGSYHYGLRAPGGSGPVMWGKWTFREIVAPERLVVVVQFSDEAGGLTRAPFFDGKWPLRTLSTTTFEPLPGGRTRLTLRWLPLEATAEEAATFAANHPSLNQGWSGTFDRLVAHLAAMHG